MAKNEKRIWRGIIKHLSKLEVGQTFSVFDLAKNLGCWSTSLRKYMVGLKGAGFITKEDVGILKIERKIKVNLRW